MLLPTAGVTTKQTNFTGCQLRAVRGMRGLRGRCHCWPADESPAGVTLCTPLPHPTHPAHILPAFLKPQCQNIVTSGSEVKKHPPAPQSPSTLVLTPNRREEEETIRWWWWWCGGSLGVIACLQMSQTPPLPSLIQSAPLHLLCHSNNLMNISLP